MRRVDPAAFVLELAPGASGWLFRSGRYGRTQLGILARSSGMAFDFEDPQACAFYQRGLRALAQAQVPFLVGGGYAFSRHTAIQRPKKDLDLFVRERDLARALEALEPVSSLTELTFPDWLGKAFDGENVIDKRATYGRRVRVLGPHMIV